MQNLTIPETLYSKSKPELKTFAADTADAFIKQGGSMEELLQNSKKCSSYFSELSRIAQREVNSNKRKKAQ